MTTRRYEMGRPVFDQRAKTPALVHGKKDRETPAPKPQARAPAAETPDEPQSPPAPAKVVRRPPPSIPPYAPGTIEAGLASVDVTKALKNAARTPEAATDAEPPAVDLEAASASEKSVAVIKPPADADEEITDTSNMRKFLLRQMVRASKGEITTETVKNIVTLSQQVYNATSLELKAAAILKNSERSIRALELVSPQDADQ